MRAVAEALAPELSHPAAEKAGAKIVTRGKALSLTFEARDSTALRAIMSSYLRMLAASLNVSNSLLELERVSQARKTDKSRNR
jgi:tRNA threonylcarbamoyladenosine modification (KEOPS) complex  Pcc1 subunit